MSHCPSVTSVLNYEKIAKEKGVKLVRSHTPIPDNQDAQAKSKCQNIILQVKDIGVKILFGDELWFVHYCRSSISCVLFGNESGQRLLKQRLGKEGEVSQGADSRLCVWEEGAGKIT